MTIAGGFYKSAEGSDAENKITVAALKAFREKGINTPTLQADIDVPGLNRAQIGDVVVALHRQNFLEEASVQRGYFSVQAFRVSEKGERLLHLAEGINPVEADKAAIIKILKSAVREGGGHVVETADVQQERSDRLVQNLKREGLLERASVQRGDFSLEGVRITDHGKAAIAAYDRKLEPKPADVHI